MFGQEAGDRQMWSLEEGNINSINTRPVLCCLHVSTDLNQLGFGYRTTFKLDTFDIVRLHNRVFFHKFIFYYLDHNAPSVLLDRGYQILFLWEFEISPLHNILSKHNEGIGVTPPGIPSHSPYSILDNHF